MSNRDKLKSLEKRRADLEIEIKDLLDKIPKEFRDTTKKPKYVDAEGFPRADIDIWSIAEVRKKVVMLQNDHIAIMKEIEGLLMSVFKTNNNDNGNDNEESKIQQKQEEKKAKSSINDIVDEKEKNDIIASMKAFISSANNDNQNANDKDVQMKDKKDEIDLNSLKPFYVIDRIFDGSPAYLAGIKSGDLIVKFGSMTHSNQSPKLMQEIVKQSINKEIPVIIKRNPEGFCTLKLIPKKWNGKGLLGCHLTPYSL